MKFCDYFINVFFFFFPPHGNAQLQKKKENVVHSALFKQRNALQEKIISDKKEYKQSSDKSKVKRYKDVSKTAN